MNAAQLDHTAKVLAEMLTFKQPSDAVLSAYFREHKNSAAKTATKSPKLPLPRCATIKKSAPPCAVRTRSRVKPLSPHWFSAEVPISAKSKTCLMKKKQRSSAI